MSTLPETEEWRAIPGFPDYEASTSGHVRRVTKSRSRWPSGRPMNEVIQNGLPYVRLRDDTGIARAKPVRQLVADAFLGPTPTELVVVNKDGDRLNSRLDNLCFGHRPVSAVVGTCKAQRVTEWPSDETWRVISRYPDYEVSDQGRVRRIRRDGTELQFPFLLTPAFKRNHYAVNLCREGYGSTHICVPHLVLEAFTGQVPSPGSVAYRDGNLANCALSNLAIKEPAPKVKKKQPSAPKPKRTPKLRYRMMTLEEAIASASTLLSKGTPSACRRP